jgi:peptidoglycan/xylan/chitin deacetylase (PgdA/CDA1 family)
VSPVVNPFWPPITPEAFSELTAYLAGSCRVTTFDGLRELPVEGPPRVVLSFDDGCRDFVEYAMPILAAYELPANHNVIVRSVETGEPPWNIRISDALNAASAATIRRLRVPGFDAGLNDDDGASRAIFGTKLLGYLKSLDAESRQSVSGELNDLIALTDPDQFTAMMSRDDVVEAASIHDIGGHSYSHEPVATFTDEQFIADTDRCSQFFAEIGLQMKTYAFPFGSYRPGQVEILTRAGVENVLGVGDRPAKVDGGFYSRITITGQTSGELRLRALGHVPPRMPGR